LDKADDGLEDAEVGDDHSVWILGVADVGLDDDSLAIFEPQPPDEIDGSRDCPLDVVPHLDE